MMYAVISSDDVNLCVQPERLVQSVFAYMYENNQHIPIGHRKAKLADHQTRDNHTKFETRKGHCDGQYAYEYTVIFMRVAY